MPERTTPHSFRFALVLSSTAVFLAHGTYTVGRDRFDELAVGWLLNVCFWAALWLVSEQLDRVAWLRRLRVPGLLFHSVFFASAGLVFAHAWFFGAAVERRLTVLDMTRDGIATFFTEALPREGYVSMGVLAALLYGLAIVAYAVVPTPPRRARGIAWLVWSALTLVACILAPRVPSPIFDTGEELRQLVVLPRITPRLDASLPFGTSALDHTSRLPHELHTPFNKVIVLVMETVTQRVFDAERAALKKPTLVVTGRPHMHSYTRYFSNDMDSRTGMLALLSARLIPYEAYGDEDVAAYEHIVDTPTLVSTFAELGYHTVASLSQTEPEAVVTDLPWKQQIYLSKEQFRTAPSQKLLCFAPDVWEQSCEDRVLLPQLLDAITSHERVFLFHEFVWGHAWEYNAASGKSNTEYYSEFADALIEALRARGLMDETLVVLTSDHGFRDKGLAKEPWVYQIPLMFYAERFTTRDDARLFSHVSFAELLFHELAPDAPPVEESPVVTIVGPTGNGMLATFTREGDFMLMRKRGPYDLLVHHARAGEGTGAAPDALLGLFLRYRGEFDRTLTDAHATRRGTAPRAETPP